MLSFWKGHARPTVQPAIQGLPVCRFDSHSLTLGGEARQGQGGQCIVEPGIIRFPGAWQQRAERDS